MSKKKKTKDILLQQKQMAAQRRKEFFTRLYEILKQIGLEEYIKDFTPDIENKLYYIKGRCFKAEIAAGHEFPPHILKNANLFIPRMLKTQKILLREIELELTLHDYYTVWWSFIFLLNALTPEEFSSLEIIREKLKYYGTRLQDETVELADEMLEADNLCKMFCEFFISVNSSLDCWLTLGELKHWAAKEENGSFQNTLTLSKVIPPIKHFVFNNKTRPAFKVGWTLINNGSCWISITPEQLYIKTQMSNLPLEIYIQNHAINRLNERADIQASGLIFLNLANSLATPKVILYKGKLLIEYRIGEDKIGYLVGEVEDGALIIRTFLFLLNEGTPEGEKFNQLTKLTKVDAQYLSIDKMSSFYSPEIAANERIKNLLIESGCESLLNVYTQNPDFGAKPKQATAKLLEEYLKITSEVQEWEFVEG